MSTFWGALLLPSLLSCAWPSSDQAGWLSFRVHRGHTMSTKKSSSMENKRKYLNWKFPLGNMSSRFQLEMFSKLMLTYFCATVEKAPFLEFAFFSLQRHVEIPKSCFRRKRKMLCWAPSLAPCIAECGILLVGAWRPGLFQRTTHERCNSSNNNH